MRRCFCTGKSRSGGGGPTYGHVGRRIALHTLAAGKATFAQWSTKRIESLATGGSPSWTTSEPLEDIEGLLAELETIRERGYAVDREEAAQNVASVATAVVIEDEPLCALGVTGPTDRLRGAHLDATITCVLGAANEIELVKTYET